ncbi:hypothetical protein TGME49_296121 [Toxoplasma gondii ME49]|uniref:Uncharacterized protein n=1 Tax=Toxoplasma gondii (strain ATCC 50611 / Me49) TaxID=508771 RepID=S8F938_TOXGM|nr:hypothetical protein TGME49_296121 [Toxoplasma gondii ME49]EPT31282.1 hypothetical protein TGME49_296121 [Toxoplasma gondii ME49]|eukprot:XP_018637916.1 hypothetical protein TGME49_296121 [Toxoplasma gondii ME49]
MVLWGPQLLLHRLIALQAVAEWLGGLHSRPGYQGGIAFFWFRLSLELQAVAASHAPDGAASAEGTGPADVPDRDTTASGNRGEVPSSHGRHSASGVAPVPSAGNDGSRSALVMGLEQQLSQLKSRRRMIQNTLYCQRSRWSSEDRFVTYKMKKDPGAFESPEAVALLKAKYRSEVDKKKREISVVEQTIREIEIEEAALLARLLECRRGCNQTPAEHGTEGPRGPSTSTRQFQRSAEAADVLQGGDDSALSRDRRRVDTRSSNRLASARILMSPADSGSGGSGLPLGLEERLELVRAQKRKTQTNLQSRRHHWSSEDAYIKYRTLASKRNRAKTGKAAEFPSPETLEKYKKSYWSQVDAKRQDMLVSEQSILDMEIEEAQLRAMLLECRSKDSEAPTEPSTEGHAGASTSTSQSQGIQTSGLQDPEDVSATAESPDVPREDSPRPGCSWWSTSSPPSSLRSTTKGAVPSPSAEDRMTILQRDLNLLQAKRTNLVAMRRFIRDKWKDEGTYVSVRLRSLNSRLKAKNMATVGLSPELHQRLSQQYRERAPQHLARVEEMSRQIMALEEEAKEVAVQLWHARRLSDPAVETQTQASTVSSATEPAETSEVAGHHSPRDTTHARRDLVKSHSEPAFEKPSHKALSLPFIAQDPTPSSSPVTTTGGASRESTSSSSITFSMASMDLAFAERFPHVAGTSPSSPSLMWRRGTFPSFPSGDAQAPVSAGHRTSGDCGEPPHSLPPPFEHPGAAHTTGDPRTESNIPEDILEFVLSHSAPAATAYGDCAALLAESTPSFIQPWSPEYSPPPIVSASEHAATSSSWPHPTTSASDEGAAPCAVPASSSAFSGPWWSSPQPQRSWRRHPTHLNTHPNSDIPASREYPDEMRYQSQGGSYVATWIEQYGPHLID